MCPLLYVFYNVIYQQNGIFVFKENIIVFWLFSTIAVPDYILQCYLPGKWFTYFLRKCHKNLILSPGKAPHLKPSVQKGELEH